MVFGIFGVLRVVESKEKNPCFLWQISKCGVIGSERGKLSVLSRCKQRAEIIFPGLLVVQRVENLISRVTLAKAGRKALFERYISGKGLSCPLSPKLLWRKRAGKPFSSVILAENEKPCTRRGLQLRRASFYHGAKICKPAVLPLAGNLFESDFPKPCFAACVAYPRRAHAARKEVTPCE